MSTASDDSPTKRSPHSSSVPSPWIEATCNHSNPPSELLENSEDAYHLGGLLQQAVKEDFDEDVNWWSTSMVQFGAQRSLFKDALIARLIKD